jgi:hypothetical protein
MVGAEDFTTLAGSIGPGGNAKRYRLAELALRDKIPLVMLLEGAGFRPSGEHYGRTPTDLLAQAQCSGKVPTVAGLLGPSAGHGALVAPVCDFTIMSRQGAIFTAGPPVVKESTGEDISKEDLGGPSVALASGVIHNLAEDDEGVLDDIRRYLSYFPSSAWSYPSSVPADETCQPRPTPEPGLDHRGVQRGVDVVAVRPRDHRHPQGRRNRHRIAPGVGGCTPDGLQALRVILARIESIRPTRNRRTTGSRGMRRRSAPARQGWPRA